MMKEYLPSRFGGWVRARPRGGPLYVAGGLQRSLITSKRAFAARTARIAGYI